jgi:hypothetical protein
MGVRIEGVKRDRVSRARRMTARLCRRDARWTRFERGRKIPAMKIWETSSRRVRILVCSAALGLTSLTAKSLAFAQAAVAVAPAEAAPAAPPAAAPEASPPVQPAPGYPYAPPPGYGPLPSYASPPAYAPPPAYTYRPYYNNYHYRAMPYPYAYPPPPVVESMDGFHTHDGFFLRVHVGIAATGFSSTQSGTKTNYSGGGSSTGIAIGGVICRDLILYGAAFGTNTTNPDKQVGGASTTGDLGSIGVGAIGPGLAYYFEHINLYLSATFGLAGFTADDNSGFKVDSSRSGAAFDLMLGKEWWVSRNWGMGIAGELFTASLKDKNVPGLTWSAGAASILFSATYN